MPARKVIDRHKRHKHDGSGHIRQGKGSAKRNSEEKGGRSTGRRTHPTLGNTTDGQFQEKVKQTERPKIGVIRLVQLIGHRLVGTGDPDQLFEGTSSGNCQEARDGLAQFRQRNGTKAKGGEWDAFGVNCHWDWHDQNGFEPIFAAIAVTNSHVFSASLDRWDAPLGLLVSSIVLHNMRNWRNAWSATVLLAELGGRWCQGIMVNSGPNAN